HVQAGGLLQLVDQRLDQFLVASGVDQQAAARLLVAGPVRAAVVLRSGGARGVVAAAGGGGREQQGGAGYGGDEAAVTSHEGPFVRLRHTHRDRGSDRPAACPVHDDR